MVALIDSNYPEFHWRNNPHKTYWYAVVRRTGDDVVLENVFETLEEVERVALQMHYPEGEHSNPHKVRMGCGHDIWVIQTANPDEWERQTEFGRASQQGVIRVISPADSFKLRATLRQHGEG